jgi:AhpD family alkylhydroperoxidase
MAVRSEFMPRRPKDVAGRATVYGPGMTDTTDEFAPRQDWEELAPMVSKAVSHLDHASTRQLDAAGIEAPLRDLMRLRASQLNGCAYCVDMHAKDARAGGETEQRIYALPVWRETPFFSERERAALGFTETVTRLTETHVPRGAYDEVAQQFNETEIAALVGLLVTINAWNTLGVATRAWEPGSYEA